MSPDWSNGDWKIDETDVARHRVCYRWIEQVQINDEGDIVVEDVDECGYRVSTYTTSVVEELYRRFDAKAGGVR